MPNARKDRVALTVLAAGGIVLTLAAFNVAGWIFQWKDSLGLTLLFCGIAFFSEFLGFNLAIAAESQWHQGRKDRFAACIFSLAVCAVINVVSGHNAWTQFEGMMLRPVALAEQASLDRERGAYLDQIAAIDTRLDAARPAPEAALGPQSRAEARQVYQIELARLTPNRERLQRRLDALPVVAPERHIVIPALVWAAFALLEVMKALVLWGVGVEASTFSTRLRSAMGAKALEVAPMSEEPTQPLPRPSADGRLLLDQLVEDNVVSMRDIASKHAARPRPGRRKAA